MEASLKGPLAKRNTGAQMEASLVVSHGFSFFLSFFFSEMEYTKCEISIFQNQGIKKFVFQEETTDYNSGQSKNSFSSTVKK